MSKLLYIFDEGLGDVAINAPNAALAINLFDPNNASMLGKQHTLANSASAFESASLSDFDPQTSKPKP